MIISIHQPNYIPWLGFFKKIESSDLFVLLDDVQFSKNDFQNRNIIRTIDGSMWLTVPIHSSSKSMINQINIVKNSNWISKHEKSIEVNYSQTQNLKAIILLAYLLS